ncbi:hypothetical protein BC938DRAFT_474240 [Jimgerdemannia flammicorona]|uniref:Uncharacterized protein n=1 Tax=Jimgerdemannia flammicorona TaxID=994334 RepID=A0A433Q2M6_9FUNG|nr:hypothetical protein BC938DRAFT_474240 [Jimgerdemannia flammicorona]
MRYTHRPSSWCAVKQSCGLHSAQQQTHTLKAIKNRDTPCKASQLTRILMLEKMARRSRTLALVSLHAGRRVALRDPVGAARPYRHIPDAAR